MFAAGLREWAAQSGQVFYVLNWAAKNKDQSAGRHSLSAMALMPGGGFDMFVATIFINILALALPLALLQVLDRVIPERDAATLNWLATGIACALLLETLLRAGRSYAGGWMGARFEHLSGCHALERLFAADITDFEKRGTGAYLERLNALASLREFYAGQAVVAIFDLPFALLFLGVIAYLAGPLVLVPVVVIALFAIIILTLGRLRTALKEKMLADDRRFGFIIEILDGIHTVKGLGMEEQMIRRYERLQETSVDAEYQIAGVKGSTLGMGSLLSGLAIIGVAGFGGVQVIQGSLSIGALLACIVLAGRAIHPLETISGVWSRFQGSKLARERLAEMTQLPGKKLDDLIELPSVEGALDLQSLTFSYGKGKDGEELPAVFRNATLHIGAGETIGIVGASASGKTTLLYLMMGLLKPTSGTARIDGYDLRECDPAQIRHQIAYLPQEGVVFKGTVVENLTMFRDDKTEDALDIARLLGLDNVVAKLPKGYDTSIGEGVDDKLPRGTRQRIAIARALVDKPPVLLFDEANSFIDGAGDEMLKELLERLKGRVTLVMVTQRPSMLRLADRIVEIRGDALFEHDLTQSRAGVAAPAQPDTPPAEQAPAL
ncbi:MAG: ABC transporter transmembrane domain-containing protein [Proteobacteria bacterium]|nr:ABC transporter transmembrane domain-containing protein [Pseudomonadota bacterium]MDA1023873.1 ABC transporter transmembrane domain-containing protein [Pseudomonadota bacterium]